MSIKYISIDPDKRGAVVKILEFKQSIRFYPLPTTNSEVDILSIISEFNPNVTLVESAFYGRYTGVATAIYNSNKYKAISLALGVKTVSIAPSWSKYLKSSVDYEDIEIPSCVIVDKRKHDLYKLSVSLLGADQELLINNGLFWDGAADAILMFIGWVSKSRDISDKLITIIPPRRLPI